MKKSQKAGDNSTNLQAESINVSTGITYVDARDIALDVFKSNFTILSAQAEATARARAEEVTDRFFQKLKEQNSLGISNAEDPDFQYSLYTVQREYAKTGDEDLGDLLVDLLVDRTKHEKRTILQIVLNESLSVAPKLTIEQLSALSIIFLIRHTVNHAVNSIPTLFEYLDIFYAPYAGLLTKNAACYQHLAFAGCGSISIGKADILDSLKRTYYGVFIKGFTKEDVEQLNIATADYLSLFTQCLHDANKIQINAMTEKASRDIAKESGMEDEKITALINLNNSVQMSNDEIKDFLIKERSYMDNVISIWDDSYMKNLNLTSVGIAIGHANVKRNVGEFTDLSIWIN